MVLEKAISKLNEGDDKGFAKEVTTVLENYSDPDYVKFCKHLRIKSPLGVKRQILKKLAKELVERATCDREVFIRGGRELWKCASSEHRALSIVMLSYLIQRDADFPLVLSSKFIKKAAGNCNSWELADDFGMNVLGLILARDIYQLDEIATWAKDPNPWLRRTIGVAAWGLYKHAGKNGDNRADSALELLNHLMTADEPEVRFGVMWPLRMLCKYEPKRCLPFFQHWLETGDENAKWIVREASKRLPTDYQDEITAVV